MIMRGHTSALRGNQSLNGAFTPAAAMGDEAACNASIILRAVVLGDRDATHSLNLLQFRREARDIRFIVAVTSKYMAEFITRVKGSGGGGGIVMSPVE
jgi:hypothetical protein